VDDACRPPARAASFVQNDLETVPAPCKACPPGCGVLELTVAALPRQPERKASRLDRGQWVDPLFGLALPASLPYPSPRWPVAEFEQVEAVSSGVDRRGAAIRHGR
jgi:hypothetical protein